VAGEDLRVDDAARDADREERDRDQHHAEECVDGAHVLALQPGLNGVAEHEVGRVEEEEDQEEHQLVV
jgi:hypothetical protein